MPCIWASPFIIIIIIIIIIHCNIGGYHSCADLGSSLTGYYLISNGSADLSKDGSAFFEQLQSLTLNLLTTTIVAPPSNASKWQMGFNSAFKGLITIYQ